MSRLLFDKTKGSVPKAVKIIPGSSIKKPFLERQNQMIIHFPAFQAEP
jgi:hypothetical protein